MSNITTIEQIVARDRWIVVTGLAIIVLLSWLYLFSGAGMSMSIFEMTTVSLFPHTNSTMSMMEMNWTLSYFLMITVMW